MRRVILLFVLIASAVLAGDPWDAKDVLRPE